VGRKPPVRYANHHERVWWWKEKAKAHPFFAICATTLKPTTVDIDHVGHFVSIGFSPGTRHYAFVTQADRDRFVNKYRPHGANPCGDPTL